MPAPSIWPWVVLGVPFAVLTALLLLTRRMPLYRDAAAGLGAGAAAGLIATEAGFAFDPYASAGKWVEAGNALVFALVGIAVIARGSANARAIAGGALGVLGLSLGLTKVPVLLHGVVLSVLPATAARAVVALTIWAGAAAIVARFRVFSDLLEQQDSALLERI